MRFQRGLIDRLPSEIRDGSYDGVTVFDVLEHIKDDACALQMVNRKLRSAGRIVLWRGLHVAVAAAGRH